MNKILLVWTILFIGLFQSGFAVLEKDDKDAAECLKKWAIEYLDMETLRDYTLEDVLATLAEKMPDELESTAKEKYPKINVAQVIKDCLNENLFNQFVQRVIDERKQRKKKGAAGDEEEDENDSEFCKFFIGLLKTVAKYVNLSGPTRLLDRMKASQCLQNYMHNNRIEKNLDEFMDGLCQNVSIGEKEITGVAEQSIKKCLEKEDAHLFDDYKKIGLTNLQKNSGNPVHDSANLHFLLFKIGLCYRKKFKPFSELTRMEKMSTLACLENCGDTFMQKFEYLREDQSNTKQPEASKKDNIESGETGVNFVGECVENGAKSIEEITSLGVKKLIVYDRAYLNMFIHQAKIMLPNYEEIKNLHFSFQKAKRIYESCAILLCEAPEASDSEIPFHSWLQNKAIMGKEVETVKASYEKKKRELENQSIDKVYEQVQAAMERDTKNQEIKIK